ncbi:MAG: YcaQ family DNA glycosylase [Acidimicrobiia bacterium]|nr:YcaQ family DNA glycosylase [Acidimicrobiia bacterium]
MRRLTLAQVRRAHIAAQGLATPRPSSPPDIRHLRRAMQTMGVLQIDSVNVVERAHQLTLFSRLGPYDSDLLWRALRTRHIFEYWTHMASFVSIADYPLWKHRMVHHREHPWQRIHELHERAPGYVDSILRQVAERGPLTPSQLEEPGERRGPWWGWADGKYVLEWMFESGQVAVSDRRNFERHYDLAERVIPAVHREAPMVPEEEAHRILLVRAAERMAVASAKGLADYYRLPIVSARAAVDALVREGALVPVEVSDWSEPLFMHPQARFPRAVEARALLNPFDPIVWFREHTERLYDFHYRIEIYTPAPKRVHGYYVFPFLLGDELVARVDLKADRKAGVLRVPGAFLETGQDPRRVARELAGELAEMARWLGMDEIAVGKKGDLAGALAKAVG